jgi:hypothetical protein
MHETWVRIVQTWLPYIKIRRVKHKVLWDKLTTAYGATGVLDVAAFRGFTGEYRMGVH